MNYWWLWLSFGPVLWIRCCGLLEVAITWSLSHASAPIQNPKCTSLKGCNLAADVIDTSPNYRLLLSRPLTTCTSNDAIKSSCVPRRLISLKSCQMQNHSSRKSSSKSTRTSVIPCFPDNRLQGLVTPLVVGVRYQLRMLRRESRHLPTRDHLRVAPMIRPSDRSKLRRSLWWTFPLCRLPVFINWILNF